MAVNEPLLSYESGMNVILEDIDIGLDILLINITFGEYVLLFM